MRCGEIQKSNKHVNPCKYTAAGQKKKVLESLVTNLFRLQVMPQKSKKSQPNRFPAEHHMNKWIHLKTDFILPVVTERRMSLELKSGYAQA